MKDTGKGAGKAELPKIVSIEDLRKRRAQRARDEESSGPEEPTTETASDESGHSTEGPQSSAGPAPEGATSKKYNPRRPSEKEIAELDRVIEGLQQDLDGVEDVRAEKVIEAKLRMSTGYYGDEKIKLRIIEAMLEAMGTDLRPPATVSEDEDAASAGPPTKPAPATKTSTPKKSSQSPRKD